MIQLNGPGKGTVYELEQGAVCTIGRTQECDICISQDLVSKNHARISTDDRFIIIEDLKSSNGTFVNGVKIAKKKLKRGDAITIGPLVFRVRYSGLDEEGMDNADSFFTDTQVIKSPSPVPQEHFSTSPEIKECIQSIQEMMDRYTDELVRSCLKIIFRVLPATRISVFTVKDDGALTQSYTIVRNQSVPTEHMSHSFAKRVMDANEAILLENVQESDQNMESTLIVQEVRSIIGVPIVIQGKKKAVILCDNLDEPEIFTKQHVKIMKFFSRVFEVLYQRDAIYKLDNLEHFLPICANCKKIRDDQGYWKELESYICQRADVVFSHSICPECAQKTVEDFNNS